jgi:hypothetical protein
MIYVLDSKALARTGMLAARKEMSQRYKSVTTVRYEDRF